MNKIASKLIIDAKGLRVGENLQISDTEQGDSLGALRDGMLAELTREKQTHSSLDLTRRQGGLLGVAGDLTSLSSDLLEQVVYERVENADRVLADFARWRHLLQDPVNVRLEPGSYAGILW